MRPRYATTAYVEALCLVRRDSHPRWYRGATVRGRRVFSTLLLGAWGAGGALLAAGCGQARQDAHEPNATFTVQVVKASFPARQAVARQSRLELLVRNNGTRTVPNAAVTIDSFAYTNTYPELASNKSPIWVVEQGPGRIPKRPVESEEISPPGGGQTAYVNTWALGPLAAGQTQTFLWRVAPVKPGLHRVNFTIAAGLAGKARTQLAGGAAATGHFTVDIAPKPPATHVDPNTGQVVSGSAPLTP